ncbi:iron-siderophore ABC transporter substrate-binding protein [Catenulispora pinisilvae]|uniref:iron-siderophore ABC transporter substrate-binding protein n=1 Tax=Catenulispora pinisilvae TaxID=2705253 RepID=UPI001E5D151C|nr:iron-siderophore ABC transporter substrate-binding protein [Catenulispora pinisilvae]
MTGPSLGDSLMSATLTTPPDLKVDEEFTRIVNELTRRGLLAGGIAGLAGLGLAACGGSDGKGHTPSASGSTRTVSSVNGAIAVLANPTRVVTLDGFTMAAMFDLGAAPIGVYSAGEQYVEPQFVERWRQIPKISDGTVGGAVDLEKVVALRPDLILGIDGQKPPYEQLKEIAPTVILPFNASNAPWRDMAQDTATALGQADALAALRKRYTERAAGIKATYADELGKLRWNLLQGGFDNGQFWLYGAASPIGGILADAGVKFADASQAVGATGQQSMSYETIGKLQNADAIFYYATNTGAPANLGPQLFAQPLWKTLPAVTTDRLYGTVYFLPSGYSDALGVLDALEAALKKLAA